MKKILWIIATVVLCIFYMVLIGILFLIGNIVVSFVTRSAMQPLNESAFNIVVWIGVFILVGISTLLYRRWINKCRMCKRWNAMVLLNIDFLKEEKIYVLVECEHRDTKQQRTGLYDQYIPGKRKTYRDTYKCRHCGDIVTRTYTKDKASI